MRWLWRYGPAELVSLLTTFVPAALTWHSTGSGVAAAVAGTWGGNVGYFGTILLRDVLAQRRGLRLVGRHYDWHALGKVLKLLLIEFGVAEIFDSFLIRPALMYWLPRWMDNFTAGIIVAKFIADVSFYLPAIFFFEWSRRHRQKS